MPVARRPSDTLRCAVVGVGHLGRFHAQKYKVLDAATLIGVCDISEERAGAVAAELGVPAFTDARALIGKVDAVTVAASTAAHFELCRLFLENGVHVLVEKPITTTSEEAEALCAIAERSGLHLQVGHVERFNPALTAVREQLTDPLFVECHRMAPFAPRSQETDVVLDLMIHDLDVIQSLMRSKPVRVSGVGAPVLTKKLDIANARIEFESGAVANVTASRVSRSVQRKFRVFLRDQYLSIDFHSGEINLTTKTGEWTGGNFPLKHEAHRVEKGDALLEEARDFVAGVIEDRPTTTGVSGRDGLEALKLAEEIVRDALGRLR